MMWSIFLACAVGYVLGVELIVFIVAPFVGYDFVGMASSLGVDGARTRWILILSPAVVAVLGAVVAGAMIGRAYERTGRYDLSHSGFVAMVGGPVLITHYLVLAGALLMFSGRSSYDLWAEQCGKEHDKHMAISNSSGNRDWLWTVCVSYCRRG
ncbi:MAG: hypothetical protein ABFS45_17300 [Pseudomonadota bacterium]